jgi:uncharacterized repeat protein (TIGR01451 family)
LGLPLQALVKDSGANGVPNVSVTFTGPSAGAGASFANGTNTDTTVTNSAGVATSLALSANATSGNYSISASAAGVTTPAYFTLTNLQAPSLSVFSSHTDPFQQGQKGAVYTITIENARGVAPTSGTVTVTEIVPSGLTLVSMSGGSTWNCTVVPTCSTTVALNGGSSYPAITVLVNVSASAAAQLINQVAVTGGGAAAASANDPTTVLSACDLTGTGVVTVSQAQLIINEALGLAPAVNDLNQDGFVNIADVQMMVNAARGMGCVAF